LKEFEKQKIRPSLRDVIFALVMTSSLARNASADIVLTCACRPLEHGNLNQYTISAVGRSGEVIHAFNNLEIVPLSGSAGVHNVWQAITNGPTPTKQEHVPPLFNADWAAYDTYFLFDDSEASSIGPNFSETNDGATTGTLDLTPAFDVAPISGFGGYSSNPVSAKALTGSLAGSVVPFLQVVMRRNDAATIRVNVLANGGTIRVENPPLSGPCVVPEPTGFLLVAMVFTCVVAARLPFMLPLPMSRDSSIDKP
jgi:hypothetical protein